MSQAKVDQYKKEKANRKETMAKEKRNKLIAKLCVSVVLVVIVAWVGVSAVDSIHENRPVETIYCNTDAVDTYINNLYAETDVEETDTDTVEGTETEESGTESVETTEE